jgi:hypothetical protein
MTADKASAAKYYCTSIFRHTGLRHFQVALQGQITGRLLASSSQAVRTFQSDSITNQVKDKSLSQTEVKVIVDRLVVTAPARANLGVE